MKLMTRTDALRKTMEKARNPLSLFEIQNNVRYLSDGWLTDGTISRRLRQWGAHCERGKDGIFRYSLRKPQQPNLFKGA